MVMEANEVMTSELQTVDPDASLQTAAQIMREYDIGVLPVITSEGRAVGMLTDRDITVRGVAHGRPPGDSKVRDAMTTHIEFCYVDDDVEQLAHHMGEKKLHRIVVVNRESKGIRGIVSLCDLAARGDRKQMVGSVLAKCASA